MKCKTIGLDLAKNVLQVHGVDERGKTVLKKALKRAQVLPFFANMPPSLIGMEACGSAHYWARKLEAMGHTVKLMAPQFVKPYVKTNKNDAADAEAICEAVSRPNMRFVPIKDGEHANGVSITAGGSVQWVLGNLGAIPTVTIDYKTYAAQGWTINAAPEGTRFTNDKTGHGMFVSVEKVDTF